MFTINNMAFLMKWLEIKKKSLKITYRCVVLPFYRTTQIIGMIMFCIPY